MERYDIVYVLKDGIEPSELIYSLRSVERNFPHRHVWFVGGHPDGLYPDGCLYHVQEGYSKFERAHSSLRKIIECKDISERFFLFNDDFFVLKPIDTANFKNLTNGTLEKRIKVLTERTGHNPYTDGMEAMRKELMKKGYDTLSYSVHIPILFDKAILAKVLDEFETPMFRSVYGNVSGEPYEHHQDVKISNLENIPDERWLYVSTTERSFKEGKVGEYIRLKFYKPSRFEDIPSPSLTELYSEEGDEVYAEG